MSSCVVPPILHQSEHVFWIMAGVSNPGHCMFYLFPYFHTPDSVIKLLLQVLQKHVNHPFIHNSCVRAEKSLMQDIGFAGPGLALCPISTNK